MQPAPQFRHVAPLFQVSPSHVKTRAITSLLPANVSIIRGGHPHCNPFRSVSGGWHDTGVCNELGKPSCVGCSLYRRTHFHNQNCVNDDHLQCNFKNRDRRFDGRCGWNCDFEVDCDRHCMCCRVWTGSYVRVTLRMMNSMDWRFAQELRRDHLSPEFGCASVGSSWRFSCKTSRMHGG